jgi:F-type H+-transporting ATPase subunit gamma
MQSIQKLKEDLESNVELTGLIDVLKAIAMAKFRALEREKERFTKFLNTFENFFGMINMESSRHPFIKGGGRLAIVIVTSDEGFMGGLNTRVINSALNYPEAKQAELIVIGEWGARYLQGLGFKMQKFPGITREKRYEDALKIRDYLFKECKSGKFGRLILVYPKPISFTVQTPDIVTILPCRDMYNTPKTKPAQDEIIQEGTTDQIIEYLMEAWMLQKLIEIFEDSNLSEFSARAVHLEQSHHLLTQKSKEIRLQYFRSHHELVDKGIREAYSSRVTRRKKAHGTV